MFKVNYLILSLFIIMILTTPCFHDSKDRNRTKPTLLIFTTIINAQIKNIHDSAPTRPPPHYIQRKITVFLPSVLPQSSLPSTQYYLTVIRERKLNPVASSKGSDRGLLRLAPVTLIMYLLVFCPHQRSEGGDLIRSRLDTRGPFNFIWVGQKEIAFLSIISLLGWFCSIVKLFYALLDWLISFLWRVLILFFTFFVPNSIDGFSRGIRSEFLFFILAFVVQPSITESHQLTTDGAQLE